MAILFNELEHNPQKMQITNNKQEFYMENTQNQSVQNNAAV